MSTAIIETIARIKSVAAQWGQLANRDTYNMQQVLQIIEYYEGMTPEERAEDAAAVDQATINDQKTKIAKLHGKIGGLQKSLNKATEALEELQNVKANNEKLARISSHAADFVEASLAEAERLSEYPTYIRLAAEFD